MAQCTETLKESMYHGILYHYFTLSFLVLCHINNHMTTM